MTVEICPVQDMTGRIVKLYNVLHAVYNVSKQCGEIKEGTYCFVPTGCLLALYNDKHTSVRPGKQMHF